MASVYLAEDLKHKRKVALKVLRPELGAERFVQEIAIVYDVPASTLSTPVTVAGDWIEFNRAGGAVPTASSAGRSYIRDTRLSESP